VLADLFFPKIWLARRFMAPGCEPVCCDGNSPMPFARGAFGYAMCSDAFQYIWTKRQFVGEMARLVDGPIAGAVVINHTHNSLAWSPSHGQPLAPAGYERLFETLPPVIFSEAQLFKDVIGGGPLDLTRIDPREVLDGDPALTIVASNDRRVYARHPLDSPTAQPGEYQINPLYQVAQRGGRLNLTLRFPNADYEDEYGACKEYLPAETTVDRSAFEALQHGGPTAPLDELIRRRVIVKLPEKYC
jgi:hypothetical protein